MTSVRIIIDRNLILMLPQLQTCHVPGLEKFTVKYQQRNLGFSTCDIDNCDCDIYLCQELRMAYGNMNSYLQCPNAPNILYQVFTLEIAVLFLEVYGTYSSP